MCLFYRLFQKTGLILGLVWLQLHTCTHAVIVDSLCEVVIPVATELQRSKEQLLQEGFEIVLLRMSGDKKALKHPKIIEASRLVNSYVNRYAVEQSQAGCIFRAEFSKARMSNLLNLAGLPILGQNRPLTLLWLLIDTKYQQKWLQEEQYPKMVSQIHALADLRAVPIILPLHDLVDNEIVSKEDVLSLQAAPIIKASERYGANTILIARLTDELDFWQGHFMLLQENMPPKIWQASKPDIAPLLAHMMDDLTEKISDVYGVQVPSKSLSLTDKTKKVQVLVQGISTLEQYAQIESYLSHLSGVKKLNVASILPESAVFELETLKGASALEKTIELDRILLKQGDEPSTENWLSKPLAYKINA